MIGIVLFFLLCAAISSIAALARGRGANPWLWGAVGVLGYFGGLFGAAALLSLIPSVHYRQGFANFAVTVCSAVAPWVGVGLVAAYVRFSKGKGKPQPSSKWVCKNCFYTNGRYAVICEACKEPWRTSDEASG